MTLKLFEPMRIGDITVANRIAMSPLTRARASTDGIPTPMAAEYYGARADAGLIITEATNISRQGRGYAFTPGIFAKDQVEAWQPITSAVHARGGRIFLQLWHVGRISHTSLQEGGGSPVAPSAIQAGEQIYFGDEFVRPSMPRALLTEEIPGIIESYATAARNAISAGFDGVEVHAANNFLLEQFIRDSTNHRTDRYGGAVLNRTRLAIEVCEAVADAIGAARVGVRMSPLTRAAGDTPLDSNPQETYGYLARELGRLSLSYLHCVEGQTRGNNARMHLISGVYARRSKVLT